MIESAVTLAELAAVTERTAAAVEAECRELLIFVGTDWAGRPAVTQEDAAGLVSGSTRRDARERAEWMTHLQMTEAWERDRRAACSAAEQAAYRSAVARGVSQPAAGAEGRRAAQEAVDRFEDEHPAPEYGGQPTTELLSARRTGGQARGVMAQIRKALG